MKTLSKKWEKSLKLMHLHENVSLDTTLWLFQSALKDLKRLFYQMDHIWGAPSMPKEPL